MGRFAAAAVVAVVGLALSGCPPAGPCQSDPCAGQPRSVCTEEGTAAVCTCPSGTIFQGGSCLATTACTAGPCTGAHQTVCTVTDGGSFSCSCDPGHAPEGDGCAATPVWDCAARHADGGEDPAEPDECPTLAGPLGLDQPAARTLLPAGDHDWFRLETLAGHVYRLGVEAESPALAVLAEVFAPGGLEVLASDSRGSSRAEVLFRAPGGGLLARVRALRLGDSGPYLVSLADLGLDDYPSGGPQAQRLVPDALFQGVVQFPGDLDAVRVLLPGLTAVRLSPVDGGFGAVVVDVLRADGGLARTLQGQGTVAVVPADEELLLRARGRTSQELGPFALQLTTLGPDDHGDDPAFATRIDPDGGVQQATFERGDDVDVLAFPQVAGHAYQVTCLLGGYGCQLSIQTASGRALGNWYTPSWLATSTEDVVLALAPTYFYVPTSPSLVRVDDLGVDDHTEVPGTPIELGTPVVGTIQAPDDLDGFTFSVPEGHAVVVTANATAGGVGLVVELRDAQGTLLARGDGSASALSAGAGAYRATVGVPVAVAGVSYLLTATDTGPDDHGNGRATADPLVPGTPVEGRLQYQGDVDAFTFTAVAGHVYSVACASTGAATQVVLRDALGFLLTISSFPSGYHATRDGTVTVEVSASPSGPALGGYLVTVTDTGPEDHGDTIATATALILGAPTAGRLGYDGDHDVFAFPAVSGHIYRVACGAGASSCSGPVLTAAGDPVALASWYSGDHRFRAGSTATLYFDFSALYAFTSQFAYSVTITDEGLDDHGDTAATATALAVGVPTTGTIQFPADVDAFSVPLVAAHFYRLDCVTAAFSSACALLVRDQTGGVVAGGAWIPTVWLKAAASGPVLVEVSGGGGVLVAYTLTVTDLGLDDHGDTAATATPVTVGGPAVPGMNETPTDVDVFSLDAGVGRILRVSCTTGVSGLCWMVARDRLGVEVGHAFSTGAGGQLDFLATAQGPFAVAVSGPGYTSAAGAYELTFEDVGTDDHGNDRAHATPLAAGATGSGVLQYQADVDAFQVTLTAESHRAQVQSAQYLQVTVLDASGAFVAGGYSSYGLDFLSGDGPVVVLIRSLAPDGLGTFTVQVQ